MMVRLEDGRVTLKPIAGTRRRGSSASEDQRLCQELLADEKERSEHMILVDLGRNELNQVCRSESIRVTDLMTVEFYSHVMHIVSTLQGELLPAYSGFDLLRPSSRQEPFPGSQAAGDGDDRTAGTNQTGVLRRLRRLPWF